MGTLPENDDPNSRRHAAEKLLFECCQDKVLRTGTDRALKKAEEAYKLATEPTRIDDPWPQLAAYRLAHLILRSAPTSDRLKCAENLLWEASRDILGPMPRLFQLAVLIRMKTLASHEDATKLDLLNQQITTAFAKAKEGIQRVRTSGLTETQAEVPIQGSMLNLLEMAAYAIGHPYNGLEGLKDSFGDLRLSDPSWFLIGKPPRNPKIRYPKKVAYPKEYAYPRDYAFEELDAIGSRHPEAILFRLCENPQWKRADSRLWERASEQSLRLIAGVLAGERPEKLRKHVVREVAASENIGQTFRQARSRARTALRQILDHGGDYEPLPDSPEGGVKLADDLTIFGAVNQKTFDKVP
jgi:hypothetical protein